jgi:hypothetical protein
MIGTAMVGYSTIRWWSKAEVQNEIALNYGQLLPFLLRLDRDDIGDATTKKMIAILRADPLWLELSFAASLDGGQRLVSATGEMEGDRLEILLLARRVEALRSFGRALQSDDAVDNRGLLPCVDACIRRSIEARVGLRLLKEFPRHGTFAGTITEVDKDDPLKYMYMIEFDDGDKETMDIDELKPLLSTYGNSLRGKVIAGIVPSYTYLEVPQ